MRSPYRQFFPERHFVPLVEVLATVNRFSHDVDELQHPQHQYHHGKPSEATIYAGMIGIGCAIGIAYNAQQQNLNRGLSPRLRDGGHFLFVTLNKEELDPRHDYDDKLFADKLIWMTRDVAEDDVDYVNLREERTTTSLFVRTNPRGKFVYGGELGYQSHQSIDGQIGQSGAY